MKLVSGKVEPEELVDQVASLLEVKTKNKQDLLETISLKDRLQKVLDHLAHEVNVWNWSGQFPQRPRKDLKTR